MSENQSENKTYKDVGVDIEAGKKATDLMKKAVKATYTDAVLAGLGSFGGLFSAAALKEMADPIQVASTDGVGTKTKVAARMNRWDTIGIDIVNHCINDILVQGAEPLFFLDYVASSALDPEQVAAVVRGVATACQSAGCALLGGETAEMPGVYQTGELDLVGTVIGVVDKPNLIDGSTINYGDAIIALPSSGLHTNGFTLARTVFAEESWIDPRPELNRQTLGDVMLAPHRSYLPQIRRLREVGIEIHGLAHITGGGLFDNLPRIFPENMAAVIERGTWHEPPIFELIQKNGEVETEEMFHVFNMGLGMLVVLPQDQISMVQRTLGEEVSVVGEIVEAEEEKESVQLIDSD